MRSQSDFKKHRRGLFHVFNAAAGRAVEDPVAHDVFISYARPDFNRIESYVEKIKKNLGLSVWIDLDQLEAGDAWQSKIDASLAASRVVVAFLSAHSLTSDAVFHELNSAIAQKKPIIPIYISPIYDRGPTKWAAVRAYLSGIHHIELKEFGGGDGWLDALGSALKKLDVPGLQRRRFPEGANRHSARIPTLSRMRLDELQSMPKENLQEGIKRLQLALDADSKDPAIQYSLGLLHLARKSYARAQEPLRAAAAVFIDDAYVQLHAGVAMIAGRSVRKLPIREGGEIFQFIRPAYEKGFEQADIVWFTGAFVHDFYVLNFLEPPHLAQYDFTPETVFDRAQSLTQFPDDLNALLPHAQFSDKILRVLRNGSDEAIDQIRTDDLVGNGAENINREKIEKFFSVYPANNPRRKAVWALAYAVAACFGWLLMLASAKSDSSGVILWTLVSPLLYVPVYVQFRTGAWSPFKKPVTLLAVLGVAAFHVLLGLGYAGVLSTGPAFFGHFIAATTWFGAAVMARRAYIHYRRRAIRAADREIDLAILLDRQRTEQSFNQLADFDRTDQRINAEIIYGISTSLREDENGYIWHYGEDGYPRVATQIVLLATFTEHQLIIYKAIFDLREDFIAQQTQHELFFRDIDTITIEIGTSQVRDADQPAKKTKKSDGSRPVKTKTKRNAKFIIRTTGGSTISVPLYDESAGEKIDENLKNRNDAAISAIRYRVQAKKTELRLAAIRRIEEQNLYADVSIPDEDPLILSVVPADSAGR